MNAGKTERPLPGTSGNGPEATPDQSVENDPTPDKLVLGRSRYFYVFPPLTLSISALAHHGQLKLGVARRRASCVPPFGMALRALMARFKMAAVNKV